MEGQFNLARELSQINRRILKELGLPVIEAGSASIDGIIELLAGNPEGAEQVLADGLEQLEGLDESINAAALAALLATALLDQRREADVLPILESGHERAAMEISSRVNFCMVRARFLARQGHAEQAYLAAGEAVTLADETESLDLRGSSRFALGLVLHDCGSEDRAEAAAREALAFYRQKGNQVALARTQSFLKSYAK